MSWGSLVSLVRFLEGRFVSFTCYHLSVMEAGKLEDSELGELEQFYYIEPWDRFPDSQGVGGHF